MLSFLQKRVSLLLVLLALSGSAMGQSLLRGTVTEPNGDPVIGATVLVKGTTNAAPTNVSGQYELKVAPGAYQVTFSSVGFTTQTLPVTVGEGTTTLNATLKADAQALADVVVVGYGTARKQDLTGAVAVIGEKDFNKGTFTSPDQLIQGRTSGVQFTAASGQPGGAASIKIRGSSAVTGSGQPLYVVDGVPLDGRTARPGLTTPGIFESGTDSNPLNFLNPSDVESVTVLKDASATAIYGARAAYGVVLIATKRGSSGAPKLDIGVSTGVSSIMRRTKFLDANQFRQALTYYGVSPATNDLGSDTDALGAILRTGVLQNYNVALSGGNETGRYRLSLGYLDQEGIVRKSGFKKYSANLATNFQFLESKRLGLDINVNTSQFREQIAPVSNNAGFAGSLITQALQWNPTAPLRKADGSLIIQGGAVVNPVAAQELFDDNSRVTTALASFSPHYKLTDWLEARVLYSVNYSTGIRRTSLGQALLNFDTKNVGLAVIGTNELLTQQVANTLNFNKKLGADLNLNAVLGYEYTTFNYSGSSITARGLESQGGFGNFGLDYTNYIQYSDPTSRLITSFVDPFTALQSYFGRAILNYKDRYLFTGTLRADQSSKFGPANRTGYFPSFSVGWDISHEDFFKLANVNLLKVRAGYGRTGNQEYPAASAQDRYVFQNAGATALFNASNPNLKWQSDAQYNVGLETALFDNRLTFTADYFYKTTTDLLFPSPSIQPAPPGAVIGWTNLQGEVVNKGLEMAIGGTILNSERVSLGLNVNATFIQNKVSGLPSTISSIPTGEVNGQGLSGARAEVIQNGLPINAFYLPQFLGLDDKGNSLYANNGVASYAGSPNPSTLLGVSLNARYQKLSLVANMTGVFGQLIYNNTLEAAGNVGQIGGGKNIALVTFQNPIKESTGNPNSVSTRWLEKGDYLKMSNVTLSYSFGDLGKFLKGANAFVIGQNLFVLTSYTGFDPEVNTNKIVGSVPSAGIDYASYPTARTFTFGINFSL